MNALNYAMAAMKTLCRLTRRRNEIHYKRRLSNYFPIKEENLKKKNEIEKFHIIIERTIRRVKQ